MTESQAVKAVRKGRGKGASTKKSKRTSDAAESRTRKKSRKAGKDKAATTRGLRLLEDAELTLTEDGEITLSEDAKRRMHAALAGKRGDDPEEYSEKIIAAGLAAAVGDDPEEAVAWCESRQKNPKAINEFASSPQEYECRINVAVAVDVGVVCPHGCGDDAGKLELFQSALNEFEKQAGFRPDWDCDNISCSVYVGDKRLFSLEKSSPNESFRCDYNEHFVEREEQDDE